MTVKRKIPLALFATLLLALPIAAQSAVVQVEMTGTVFQSVELPGFGTIVTDPNNPFGLLPGDQIFLTATYDPNAIVNVFGVVDVVPVPDDPSASITTHIGSETYVETDDADFGEPFCGGQACPGIAFASGDFIGVDFLVEAELGELVVIFQSTALFNIQNGIPFYIFFGGDAALDPFVEGWFAGEWDLGSVEITMIPLPASLLLLAGPLLGLSLFRRR